MKYFSLFLLLVLPAIVCIFERENGVFVRAVDEDDDSLVDVEGEEQETSVTDEGGEEAVKSASGAATNADTTVLFTKPVTPVGTSLDLPAGQIAEFLVGFSNKGNDDFVLETLDASFRYPMDFSFYIQNFTTIAYNKRVKPHHEATLAYSFIPAEAFAGRPFGLSINLRYRDAAGEQYYEGIYNETVNIVEIDEGLDGETFFLYVFLGGCVVLLLVVGQQLLYSIGKRRRIGGSSKKQTVELGTKNDDVDYEWIPKETLAHLNQSPKTPKQSPRQRKPKKSPGKNEI
ncbi:unnamed protein product [Bemisia tabaci]|uniref:Translocon-associated protein subunit alpha n=1 Tax=Bemisia tabaci TaxID=7038 RepID=A0A9P0A742_BEMTA|nr:PREDICTED: translocon-associated protein subunit alpha [Bemisia tabaci]CAH0384547.1 unnamed protein product [Bemisia tabaci]